MYTINHVQDTTKHLDFVELANSKNKSYAKIHLNHGASLHELTLNENIIIADLHPLTYSDTYASSILFPFANRVKDGAYSFNEKSFQLAINQKEENNALHGLVYNKTFKLTKQDISKESASIELVYNETKTSKGFPFTYSIILKYTLCENNLGLHLSVKNTDEKTFPFTLGWHPYFLSADLHNSSLNFDSTKKLQFGERNITESIKDIEQTETFHVKDKQLDDCWVLNSNTIQFNTPSYNLEISSSAKNNYLQLYTPPHANTIAIEPTTGVSNSLNNKIGLQTLNPRDSYSLNWNIKILAHN